MSKKPSLAEQLAEDIETELLQDIKAGIGDVFGELDSVDLSQPAFLAYVRDQWADAAFRKRVLDQVAPPMPNGTRDKKGVKAYHDLVSAAWPGGHPGFPPPPPPMPEPAAPLMPAANPSTQLFDQYAQQNDIPMPAGGTAAGPMPIAQPAPVAPMPLGI